MTTRNARLRAGTWIAAVAWLFLLSVPSPTYPQECLPEKTSVADSAAPEAGVWCNKEFAQRIRAIEAERVPMVQKLAESLISGDESYVYLRRTSEDTRILAATNLLNEQFPEQGPFTAAQIRTMMAEQPELREQLGGPIWYFHTNSASVQKAVRAKADWDISSGMIRELGSEAERSAMNDMSQDASRMLGMFGGAVELARPKLIIIDGEVPGRLGPLPEYCRDALVLKVASPSGSSDAMKRASLFANLLDPDPDKTAIVNLLPTKAEEAAPWGFGEHKAEMYSANGRRVAAELERYGYNPLTFPTGSKKEILAAISEAAHESKLLILVGESADGGQTVRIPGTTIFLTPRDFASLPEETPVLALICDSQNAIAGKNGMSVVGRIYTDQARAVLKLILDRRPPATAREYLDAPWDRFPIGQALSSTSVPATAGTYLVLMHGRVAGITPASSIDSDKHSSGKNGTPEADSRKAFFLAGILGGGAREILRWKRLKDRGRSDKYLRPQFLAISATEIVFGGFTALVFANSVPSIQFQIPVSFVCGVGFEEIVRRASHLDIWVPKEPLGGTPAGRSDSGASALEFLRQ